MPLAGFPARIDRCVAFRGAADALYHVESRHEASLPLEDGQIVGDTGGLWKYGADASLDLHDASGPVSQRWHLAFVHQLNQRSRHAALMQRRRSPRGVSDVRVTRAKGLWRPEVVVRLDQGHHPQPLHHSRFVAVFSHPRVHLGNSRVRSTLACHQNVVVV